MTPSLRIASAPRATVVEEATRQRGGFIITIAMMVCLPLVAIQGPAHTTPMDVINAVFIVVSWSLLLARRQKLAFPLLTAFWLILIGSCTGAFAAPDPPRALLCVVEDLYLYLWFITLHDFLSRRSRVDDMALIFAAVACFIALITWADAHLGLFGGRFAGAGVRATGTFENPNMFGDYLLDSFFLTWALAAAGRRIWYLALPLLLAGILATASNGCLAALIAGLGVTLIAYRGFWQPRQLGAALVAAGLVVGIVGAFHDQLQQMAVERFSGGRSEMGGAAMKGASERLPIWENVMIQTYQRPTGVGPGNFGTVDQQTTGDEHAAHSEYLGMLAERGVIGFVGWCGIMIGVYLMLVRVRAAAAIGFEPLAIEQLYGLFGCMAAHAVVIELSHFRHTWMVFAVVAATATQATRLTTTPAAAPTLAEAA